MRWRGNNYWLNPPSFLAGVGVSFGQPLREETEGGREDHQEGGDHREANPPGKYTYNYKLS
jgi:hypothetical protein